MKIENTDFISSFPKISIVTPSFNQGQYLEQTILSVISQGYPDLEYIIIDGGSTDNSVEIIKKYEDKLTYWVSEPDNGMYDAIQKGFEKSTGEIMGWINSDDMLHSKSLFIMAEVFSLDGVQWIQGLPNVIDEWGRIVRALNFGQWSEIRLYTDEVCIQQESTFWTRKLWKSAGGYIDRKYKYAGDFELWSRFFKHEKLFTLSCLLGSFRLRKEGQLSQGKAYVNEKNEIVKRKTLDPEIYQKITHLNRLMKIKKLCSRSRIFNVFFLVSRIDKKINAIHDFPQKIEFYRETQKFGIIN